MNKIPIIPSCLNHSATSPLINATAWLFKSYCAIFRQSAL